MSTVSTQIASQSFSKRVNKLRLPYLSQASGFYLFGGNASQSVPNLAYGQSGNPLTVVGTPTYGTGYAVIGRTNGFETNLLLDTPYTQILVSLQTVAAASLAVISRANGADGFVDMIQQTDSASFTIAYWPDGTLGGGFDNLQSANFRFFGQSWTGSGGFPEAFVWDSGKLLSAAASSAKTKTVTPTTTLKFGCGNGSGGPATKLAAAALFPVALSRPQVKEIYHYLFALLTARGLTVIP